MSASTADRIVPGRRFRAVIADCNALWEIKEREGRASWRCVVVPEPEPVEVNGHVFEGEYLGTEQVFTSQQINRSLAISDIFVQAAARDEVAWESIQPGQTVHYHNGFGEFYRCEVVLDGDDKKLRAVAMVGNWAPYKTRGLVMHDGSIRYPFETEKITGGELFAPGASSIYESSSYVAPRGTKQDGTPRDVDPRDLDPIEILTPQITDADREFAEVYLAIKAAEAALTDNDRRDIPKDQRARDAREILAAL